MQSYQGDSWSAKSILEKKLVGGSETGSRPSRKCKSMRLISDISVSNVMSHSFHLNRVVPESTRGVQRQEKHTGSLHAFAMFFQVTMWTKCFLQLNLRLHTIASCECSFQPWDDAMATSAPVLYPSLNGRGESQISRFKIWFLKFKVQQLQLH